MNTTRRFASVFTLLISVASFVVGQGILPYDDPAKVVVKNAGAITVDGKLDEADWAGAPTLLFGLGAAGKKQAGELTVTGGIDVKNPFMDNSVSYSVPHTDSSLARVKFLRNGLNLYIGIQSDDRSICKFGWEGDGLFMKIRTAAGQVREYKLYWQNFEGNKDTMRYEPGVANSGSGWGYLPTGSTVNDTSNVDQGYTAELMIDLSKLGYTLPLTTVQVMMNIFDPDGFQHPMNEWDHTIGSYFKSWWGSEWGDPTKTLEFTPEPYDDPAKVVVKNAGAITVDGKLDEADWAGAPTLLFGLGAAGKKQGGELTVTGGVDVKNPFMDNGVQFYVPHKDSSLARVKFLRRGLNLYIGIQSDDKSICKFGWEGDGLFMKIRTAAGQVREYKLYWQNFEGNKDTMRYEPGVANSGSGWGYLPAGSTVNDTSNADQGYTAELLIDLSKLGYTLPLTTVQVMMNIFDPDGFKHPMNEWDHTIGSYFKSWWGSEWGDPTKTLEFTPEPYDDPAKVVVKNARAITVDGKLDEADWTGAPTLLYGLGAEGKKQAGEFTVTGGIDVKNPFTDNGVQFSVPHTDSSLARVKFLRDGLKLYIGIQSDDKSICKFGWEGDGLFMKIKTSAGQVKEYKLYWQNFEGNKDTMRYEPGVANSGSGWGYLPTGSTVNDTSNVDKGYTAELMIDLSKLGYTLPLTTVQVMMNIFDPDGFKHPMNEWDHTIGSYYKSWWGSEWGDPTKTLEFTPELFDDPAKVMVKNAGTITVDGILDEADWTGAPTLLFGLGAAGKKQEGGLTVTGGIDVKNPFTDNGVQFYVPHKDSSLARVKFLRNGLNLYIGIQSDDKSICKFDWEGDGLYMKIRTAAGQAREYKLYWQNFEGNKDTMRYEPGVANSGSGRGYLPLGSTVNDTLNSDQGYTAELLIDLSKLGYTLPLTTVQVMMNIFDPDGLKHPMNQWDHTIGSFYKSWWGSEWGDPTKTLEFTPEPYDDPAKVVVKNAGAMTVDGKLDEADWSGAPTLLFGLGAAGKKQGGELTVTGGVDVKNPFTDNGASYSVPHKDSTLTRVKFLRRGLNLYIGIQSDDKSICKFDWEGDGLYMKIRTAAGQAREYKLYWQNFEGNKDTMRYEPGVANSGSGWGYLPTGSTVNDTSNVDQGYTAELMIDLSKLGYTLPLTTVQVMMNIFDPDGFKHPMNQWDHTIGSYYKSWWGSEWGDPTKTLEFKPELFDDPDSLRPKVATGTMTLDGKLDEADWTGAPTLLYGLGAEGKKQAGEFTVTGGVDVKNPFTDNGVSYSVPHKDSTLTRVKFLQKGLSLYIGIQSDDKSICKFDWEGDGLYMKINTAAGQAKEYKLYWQNFEGNKDTMRYEPGVANSGAGWGYLPSGSTVNEPTNVDNGYTAELRIDLDKLGYTTSSTSAKIILNIFDPDGFKHPMNQWDHTIGSYYKSWWGSEWGDPSKTLKLNNTTGIDQTDGAIPRQFALEQNYPNPFNPSTMINFGLPARSLVTLRVYDVLGRQVAILVDGELNAGVHRVTFNASGFSTGMYIYRLSATPVDGSTKEPFAAVKKLMLLK